MFLHPRDVTFKLLRKSTAYFGYIPRRCFDASYSESRLKAKTEEVLARIREIGGATSSILQALNSYRIGADTLSHKIFQNKFRQLETCNCEVVSRWVFDSLMMACETHEADASHATAKFYRNLSGVSWAGAFRGRLFERQALKYFDDIDGDLDLSIRRLHDSVQKTWTYHGPIPRSVFQETTVIGIITNAIVATDEPVHLVPSATNFAAVDSIVYYPNDVLTCIQTTMNYDHPIAVSGLRRIQRWLKSPLEDLRPKKKEGSRWRFIFIVPEWSLLSNRRFSKMILRRANGLERWTNMCWSWKCLDLADSS
jgi:hypothetical protein